MKKGPSIKSYFQSLSTKLYLSSISIPQNLNYKIPNPLRL